MVEDLFHILLRGIIIGVVVSAPMGPVGIFCLQRTLDRGRMSGFYTGVGAAISDLIYCLLTGFGLSFIEDFINTNRSPIQLFGASVLIGFGIWLIRKKPDDSLASDAAHGLASPKGDILKGFALTFSNPLILFLIIGLFAQFNFVIEGMRFYHYILGFIGIIAGALGWWWVVTYFVDKLRGHFNMRTMKLINTVIGVIILVFAVIGIISSVSAFAAKAQSPPAPEVRIEGVYSFRVADKSMKGWHVDMADSSGVGFRMSVSPDSKADAFGDTSVDVLSLKVEDLSTGRILAENVVTKGIDAYKGTNAWRLSRSSGVWRIFAGNREYNLVTSFPDIYGSLSGPEVKTSTGGDISVTCLEADVQEAGPVLAVYESALRSFIADTPWRKTDPQGIYLLYDSEHDDSYALIGGDYRMVLMPGEDEECLDLVYLEGAGTLAGRWRPGMRKARLRATPFRNVFDVEWTDAAGEVMRRDIKADFDELTQILTVRFPYQNSIMRFRKE